MNYAIYDGRRPAKAALWLILLVFGLRDSAFSVQLTRLPAFGSALPNLLVEVEPTCPGSSRMTAMDPKRACLGAVRPFSLKISRTSCSATAAIAACKFGESSLLTISVAALMKPPHADRTPTRVRPWSSGAS
jgi:hypothetical protein